MIDKITGDVCCFRAASHITKENHSTESGVARFVWENNQLFMSFDSSNGTGYKTPIRKSTFINNSFVVKSNNSTYSGFSSEKTGLWKSNTGEPCIGFFPGWLWKSSVLPELFLNESTLEVYESKVVFSVGERSWVIYPKFWEIEPVTLLGSDSVYREYYILSVQTNYNTYSIVLNPEQPE